MHSIWRSARVLLVASLALIGCAGPASTVMQDAQGRTRIAVPIHRSFDDATAACQAQGREAAYLGTELRLGTQQDLFECRPPMTLAHR